jgi:hypothetical protein
MSSTGRSSPWPFLGLLVLAPVLAGSEQGGSCGDRVVPIGGDPIGRGGDFNQTSGGSSTDGAGSGGSTPDTGPGIGGSTSDAGNGGSTSDAGTGESSNPDPCAETATRIRNLIGASQNCAIDADCTIVVVTCLSNTLCTGAFYVNTSLNRTEVERLDHELNACVNGDPNEGCPVCFRTDAPPVCVNSVCQAMGANVMLPCAGKKCGDECTTCVPMPDHPCDAPIRRCDANGFCGGPKPCP